MSRDFGEQVRSARLWARYRCWEDSTHRDLIQLPGFTYPMAWAAVAGEPLTGVGAQAAAESRRIVELHHQMRDRLDTALSPVVDGRTEQDLVAEAAWWAVLRQDLFSARIDLTVELASRGLSEIVLPGRHDPVFWDAVDSSDEGRLARYLLESERTWHPLDPQRRQRR